MRTKLINFTVPGELLKQVDKTAEEESRSRSSFIREALRSYLRAREERKEDFGLIKQSAQRINLSEEETYKLIDQIRRTLPMNQ